MKILQDSSHNPDNCTEMFQKSQRQLPNVNIDEFFVCRKEFQVKPSITYIEY